MNGTAPDGYSVNGEGAWEDGGVVQTMQAEEPQVEEPQAEVSQEIVVTELQKQILEGMLDYDLNCGGVDPYSASGSSLNRLDLSTVKATYSDFFAKGYDIIYKQAILTGVAFPDIDDCVEHERGVNKIYCYDMNRVNGMLSDIYDLPPQYAEGYCVQYWGENDISVQNGLINVSGIMCSDGDLYVIVRDLNYSVQGGELHITGYVEPYEYDEYNKAHAFSAVYEIHPENAFPYRFSYLEYQPFK